ncbi:MAG: SusC/RagA family TonB-linked outer membrane protein [Coprobacter sp.]|nr:SusC/RagA family TonB-linked outer membrane protein [Coprobacter sp.]
MRLSFTNPHKIGRICKTYFAGALLLWSITAMPIPVIAAGNDMPQTVKPTGGKHLTGTITDKKTGDILPGVTVSVWKNNKLISSAFTSAEGKYRILKPEGKYELRISTIGYKSLTIEPTGDVLDLQLEDEATTMKEVVVTGFFNKSKESFTGAVQQVSGMELKQISSTNIFTALSALTPGMEMVQNHSMGSNPNHVPELIIRGTSSFSNEGQSVNQPTIILDGSEITMQDLYDLDMNEVESINVLKDASASALYGSKAANGVIVITRKPIKESSIRVAYNFTGNFQFPDFSDYNILNASEKLEYERLAGLYDAGGAINSITGLPEQYALDELYNLRYKAIQRGQTSDWMKQPARAGISHDHSLRVYGGASNLRYELTGRFGNTNGVMKDDYRKRYNLGFKLDYFVSNSIQISNRTTYAEVSVKDTPYGSFSQYTQMNPYDAMFNADGTVNTELAWDLNNPLYEATLGNYDKSGTRSLTNTTDFRWDINKEFRLTGHFTITTNSGWDESYTSPLSQYYKNESDFTKKGSRLQTSSKGVNYSANIVGAYNKFFKDKSLLSLTAGWELNYSDSESETTRAIGFFNDQLSFISNAAGYPTDEQPFGSQSETSDVGAFLTGSYTFRNRYLVEGTYRLTGSSLFGENNRFGHFWSAGAGWNIHNEDFLGGFDNIDLLKLRGSVGYTGKVSFSAFQAMTMYQYLNTYEYKYGIGAIPLTIGNVNLSWERTLTYNVGVDVSLFNRRLNLVIDAYIKNTQDLLLDKSMAPSTGVTTATDNLGEMQNKGIEFQLDGYIFRTNDFYWKLGVMGYANRNKITKINNALEEMNKQNEENQYASLTPLPQYAEGESVSALKLVRSAGIDPATGQEIYIKRNGELTFTYDTADKVLIGDTEPKFTGSINTSLYYKGFSVYALFSMRCGAWVYNTTRVTKVEGSDPKNNADQRVFDSRWKNPGDLALYKDIADQSRPQQTDRFAEKENTLTLQSLNFGYEFPQKICSKLRMRNLRVSLNLTDIMRISSVKIERGTDYLYSQGFEFTLSTTF